MSFLPGCASLVTDQQPVIPQLAPLVARHLVEQRALAVHDLVVRERQDEVLRERVHERERDQVVVVAAIQRVERHVAQRVVHPAHVPLEVEAEAAEVHRPRHAGERRGFLRHRQHAGEVVADRPVELLAGTRSLPGSRGRRSGSASIRRACGRSRDTASRRPRPRANRRCDSPRSRTVHSRPGNCALRGGRS